MIIIGERYKERLESGLKKHAPHYKVIWMPDNPALDRRIAGHADLSVFCAEKDKIIIGRETYPILVNNLTNMGYVVIQSSAQGQKYPEDAGLCVCSTGKYDIYNPKTVDPIIKHILRGVPVHVSQGYTKCSACVVRENAIITSDSAIASKASYAGLDVLKISPGHIVLEGYKYGFIGGASFMLNDKTIAFTGLLDLHPDKSSILRFIEKYGITPMFLTQEPIFDIGGAVPLP